jgi:membrane-anchored protein YejM (alkaline phosphatase superfamily)
MKQRKLPKHKKGAWFVAIRGSYLPVSWQGWLSYLPYIFYLVFSMEAAKYVTNSTLAAVLIIVPNWIAATVAMTWLARRTS